MSEKVWISEARYRALIAAERDKQAEINRLSATVGRVRMLCLRRQVEDADGNLSDAGTLWPSEVIAAIDGPRRPEADAPEPEAAGSASVGELS